MDQFIKKHKLPQFIHYYVIDNLNSPVTIKDIEFVTFKFQKRSLHLENSTKHLKN